MEEEKFQGLPGIDRLLTDVFPVKISADHNHMINSIIAQTGLSKLQTKRIISLFFEELRSAMFARELVIINLLGAFSICVCKKNTVIRFLPDKILVQKTNESQ